MNRLALLTFALTGLAFAQNNAPPPQPRQMPRTTDAYGQPIGAQPPQDLPAPPQAPQPPQPGPETSLAPQGPQGPPAAPPPYGVPPEVTVRPGTFVTVRVNQELSSNRNQPGDTFSATLTQPIVVEGVVVAQRGQTVFGHVTDAEKSRGGKRSRLGLELTGLTFADGSQENVRSQQVLQEGPRQPAGQQVGTIANTTLIGAVVGNAINWRDGGAIGAAVGAGAGLAAVMVTRNGPSVVYPESVLTFQLQSPVTVATGRAPGAFRYADSGDYQPEPPHLQRRDRDRGCRGCGPLPGYGPYWGPSIGIGIGYGYPGWGPGWYGYGRRRWL